MDRLSEMEAFAAVVDQGGFTGAALKLGVSKSAVSKHVSSLENRLGIRLLDRTTRRVNPTEIGLLYYHRARSVLAAALEADAAVTALQRPPSGTLQVVTAVEFGETVLSPRIGDFLKRYPELDVSLVLSDTQPDLIAQGLDLSLSIGATPGPGPGLGLRRIATVTRHLVASPAYLDRNGPPRRVEDLGQHRLLHLQGTDIDPGWSLVTASGETRIVRTRARLAANSALCLRDTALAGLGIAFLPDFLVADDLAQGRLVPALPGLPEQAAALIATYPPERGVLPRVRAFLDFVAKIAAPEPVFQPARRAVTG